MYRHSQVNAGVISNLYLKTILIAVPNVRLGSQDEIFEMQVAARRIGQTQKAAEYPPPCVIEAKAGYCRAATTGPSPIS
jgi:hypothetical protein